VTRELTHITSNTGHVAVTSRSEVADSVIELLRPVVAADGGLIARPGEPPLWHLDIWRAFGQTGAPLPGMAAFQVAPGPHDTPEGKRPYVMAVACWEEAASAEAWARARELAKLSPPDRLPDRAPAAPWLAVTIMPGMFALPPELAGMLGDFERCVFWTLVEADGGER
jgi:hypothetical protein